MAPRKSARYAGPPVAAPPAESDEGDFEITPKLEKLAAAVCAKAETEWKLPASSALIECPLQVLFATLRQFYENDIEVLLGRAKTIGENARLSQGINTVFARRDWSVATARKYATTLKRILGLLTLPDGFVESLRLVTNRKGALTNKSLGKYGALLPEHPTRVRLEEWLQRLRDGTRNRSELGLRNILIFYCNVCLPALGLDLDNWPVNVAARIAAHIDEEALRRILGEGRDAGVKAGRLRFLLQDILGATEVQVPEPRKRLLPEPEDDDDGRDLHRISAEHLDLLHVEASKHPLDAFFFMLMITTGLRVGGVVKMLIRNVADVKNGRYEVKTEGKTKEKGNKFARFVICPQVRGLLQAWLTAHRPADDGPYVFPGAASGRPMTTDCLRSRFNRMCKNCGLEGQEFHPHALRHTNAHILLECGNSVESVSKCLNHSSTSVTEKFYLRESAAEVQARCNVPWIRTETESEKKQRAMEALPSFLKADTRECSDASKTRGDEGRKRQRREIKDALLRDFTNSSASSAG